MCAKTTLSTIPFRSQTAKKLFLDYILAFSVIRFIYIWLPILPFIHTTLKEAKWLVKLELCMYWTYISMHDMKILPFPFDEQGCYSYCQKSKRHRLTANVYLNSHHQMVQKRSTKEIPKWNDIKSIFSLVWITENVIRLVVCVRMRVYCINVCFHQSMRFAILITELASQIILIESTDKIEWKRERENVYVCVYSVTFAIVYILYISRHQSVDGEGKQSPNPENVQCNWIIYICYLKWAVLTQNSKQPSALMAVEFSHRLKSLEKWVWSISHQSESVKANWNVIFGMDLVCVCALRFFF